MNYKLSIGVDRPKGKACYVLELGGREIDSKIQKIKSRNIKEEALNILEIGLRSCRSIVKHDDILIIDIQNRHLHQWLDESVEYNGYNESLDKVFDTLDTLDCRYRFSFNPKTYALKYIDKYGKTDTIQGSSIADMF